MMLLQKPTTPAAKKAKRSSTADASLDDDSWICPICSVAYQEDVEMIACDKCDRWFHWFVSWSHRNLCFMSKSSELNHRIPTRTSRTLLGYGMGSFNYQSH